MRKLRNTLALALACALTLGAAGRAFAFTVPVAASFSTAVPADRQSVIQLQGSDAEGTSLVYATTSSPSHGALSSLNTATGYVVYTPTSGYVGADSFNYTVTSGGQTSAAGTVTITVTNAKTTVTDTVTDPSGSPRSGKVTFILTQATTTPAGISPVGASVSAALNSSGTFTAQLYPSRSMSPAAYYQVYFNDAVTLRQELLGVYDIPASTTVVTLSPYKVTDTNLAARYTFASAAGVAALTGAVATATAAQLFPSLTVGKHVVWNGTFANSLVSESGSTVTVGGNQTVTGTLTAGSYAGITSGNVTGALGFAPLNPASNLSDLASAAGGRTSLGLGTLATQNASSVSITGGTLTNVTCFGCVAGVSGSGGVTNNETTVVEYDGNNDGVGFFTVRRAGVDKLRVENDGRVDAPAGFTDATRALMGCGAGGVSVTAKATAGAGTSGSPYTGWDTAIGTWQSGTTYCFDAGKYYDYTTPIVILNTTMTHLVGAGSRSSVLRFNGTGKALTFKSDTVHFGNSIRDIEIHGNPNATEGLYTESSHSMTVTNVNVKEVSQKCFHVKFAVLNTYRNIRCSKNDGAWTTTPVNGFVAEGRSGTDTFQANTINNIIVEHVTGDGIVLSDAWQNQFIGGTSEQNGGRGLYIAASSKGNTFQGTDFELNTLADVEVVGRYNRFENILSAGTFLVKAGARKTVTDGGQLNSLVVESGAFFTTFRDLNFNLSGAGTITNADDTTAFDGPITDITAGASGDGNAYPLPGGLSLGRSYSLTAPAWDYTNQAVINLGGAGSIHSDKGVSAPTFQTTVNGYFDGTNWRYRSTGLTASNVYQSGGEVFFRTAPSGTAGGVITWTTTGKFGADGKLYVNDGGALKGVTYGAADSGGTGFKVLRIAN